MVTGRTRPKENALVGAHRALRPKILFEVLHIIIKELVPFSKRRGLGHPQKQSPVLSVPEMYMEALLAIFIPKNQSENLEQECGEKSIFIMKILFKVELKSYVPLGHKISFIRALQKIERAYPGIYHLL